MKKQLLISNTVYGEEYAKIFLDYHIKSFLDESNIPTHKDRIFYSIYTDEETLPILQSSELLNKLAEICRMQFFKFTYAQNIIPPNERYRIQIGTFRMQIREAIEKDAYLSSMAADLVVGKNYIGKILNYLDSGHDAVLCVPMRTSYESLYKYLKKYPGTPSAMELFEMAYAHMHPLWVASHWDASQFTKIPYTLLWNSGTGLLAHSFSVSPIAFVPEDKMRAISNVMDTELPSHFKNPYWCENWIEVPIIGLEHLKHFYPPFMNHKSNIESVKGWSMRSLHPTQIQHLKRNFYFPNKSVFGNNSEINLTSEFIVNNIVGG